jgi:hypothetical protein
MNLSLKRPLVHPDCPYAAHVRSAFPQMSEILSRVFLIVPLSS